MLDQEDSSPDEEAPTTIVMAQYLARRWWGRLLCDQAAKRLSAAPVGRERTAIADVPYRREQ